MDIRAAAAGFYDADPGHPADLPFHMSRLLRSDMQILELGSGTGRVLVPLAERCSHIHGIEISEAMVSICRRKMEAAHLPAARATVSVGDISDFALNQGFDFILAPFRVLQNLSTDQQVAGLFRCIGRHLNDDGACILNVFSTYAPPDVIAREWVSDIEHFEWEVPYGGGTLRRWCRNTRMTVDPLVLYPDLIHRLSRDGEIVDEAVLSIAMRCYYPDQFTRLVVTQGFRPTAFYGGYAGEKYGEGPELVIQFGK